MFDKLIVSEPDQDAVKNRRGYFMVSSLVVGVLFITAVVVSIFAADFNLGTNDFELAEMLAPVDLAAAAAPEPQRPQPRQLQSRSNDDIPTRTSAMSRVDEPTLIPNSTSTARNTEMSRPDGRYNISDHDSDPTSGISSGRNVVPGGDGPSGGLTVAENRPKPADDTPPPARVTPPKPPTMVSKGVINGIAQDLPKPAYSAAARAVRAQGKVDVQVTIDESGRVISARAASGHPLLREAAETAARRARFSPTTLSQVPVKVTGVIVYNFVP